MCHILLNVETQFQSIQNRKGVHKNKHGAINTWKYEQNKNAIKTSLLQSNFR